MPQAYPPEEDALPPGHPCRADYDPTSKAAAAWRVKQASLTQTSGLPPRYKCDPNRPNGTMSWEPGVDPQHPELEPFTGLQRRPAPPGNPTYGGKAKPGVSPKRSASPATAAPGPTMSNAGRAVLLRAEADRLAPPAAAPTLDTPPT